MKKFCLEFLHRGLLAGAFGPVVLAVVYGILGAVGVIESLTPGQVCGAILSVTLMAFVAAGITEIYTVERLPLISAILIHAGVLYLDYLMIYLVNGWMPRDWTAFGIFTVCFAVGYALIWVGIWRGTKARTERLNRRICGEE